MENKPKKIINFPISHYVIFRELEKEKYQNSFPMATKIWEALKKFKNQRKIK